jgi:hypothetical protein
VPLSSSRAPAQLKMMKVGGKQCKVTIWDTAGVSPPCVSQRALRSGGPPAHALPPPSPILSPRSARARAQDKSASAR